MGVNVDEAGRDDQVGRVQLLAARCESPANGGDLAAPQRHIGDPVKPRLRVHDPPAADHAVESRLGHTPMPCSSAAVKPASSDSPTAKDRAISPRAAK